MKQTLILVGLWYVCAHCGQRGARLHSVEHDVTPEIEPDVTFVFECRDCSKKSFVDMSDVSSDYIDNEQYSKHAYK